MCFLLVRNYGALLSKIGLARYYTLNKRAHGCTEMHRNLLQNTDFPHSKKITIYFTGSYIYNEDTQKTNLPSKSLVSHSTISVITTFLTFTYIPRYLNY